MTELDDRGPAHVLDRARRRARRRARDPLHRARRPAASRLRAGAAGLRTCARSLRPLRPLRADRRRAAERGARPRGGRGRRPRARVSRAAARRPRAVAADVADAAGDAARRPGANRAALLAGVDGSLDDRGRAARARGAFGVAATGWGYVYAGAAALFAGSARRGTRASSTRWDARLDRPRASSASTTRCPRDRPTRSAFALLRRAEALVIDATSPITAAAAGRSAHRVAGKRRRSSPSAPRIRDARRPAPPTLAELLAASRRCCRSTHSTPSRSRSTELERRASRSRAELHGASTAPARAIVARARGDAGRARRATTPRRRARRASTRSRRRQGAVRRGRSGSCPSSRSAPSSGDEWRSALAAWSPRAARYRPPDRDAVDHPVDDWLLRRGARAREAARLEAGRDARRARSGARARADAVQLPHAPGALAGARVPGRTMRRRRRPPALHGALPAARSSRRRAVRRCCSTSGPRCIPGDEADDTGIAFHYDRPDSEPPQAMLLVTPATGRRVAVGRPRRRAHETLDLAKLRAVEPAARRRDAPTRSSCRRPSWR